MLTAAVLDATLNYSNSSMVLNWHPVDFQGEPLRDSKYFQNNYAPRFAHFGQKSAFGTQTNLRQVVHTLLPLSPSSIIRYQRKLGSEQAYRVVHQPVSRGLAVFADAWLSGWLAEISADLGYGKRLRIRGGASRQCAIQIHVLYFYGATRSEHIAVLDTERQTL